MQTGRYESLISQTRYFNGELIGAMDFDVSGACSQRRLRELLSKQISDEMVKAIENNIREYTVGMPALKLVEEGVK
jgi:hypothetical protein